MKRDTVIAAAFTAVAGTLTLWLMQPAQAGTSEAPSISPEYDMSWSSPATIALAEQYATETAQPELIVAPTTTTLVDRTYITTNNGYEGAPDGAHPLGIRQDADRRVLQCEGPMFGPRGTVPASSIDLRIPGQADALIASGECIVLS